jgi:phage gpG-like protein
VAKFRLNESEVRKLLSSPGGGIYGDIQRRGNRVLNKARVLCPVDQGQLRASLAMEMNVVDGNPIARIGTNVKYAIFVHEGTGIHGPRKTPIVPVRARVLRWPVKNQSGSGRRRFRGGATQQYAYSKSVKGTKGRPFLTKALLAAK